MTQAPSSQTTCPECGQYTDHVAPIVVPPDKAPLRAQGDLQGTLALLQELYTDQWLHRDMGEFVGSEDSLTVGQLIATAVQQAEALPKGGDLARWQEKADQILDEVALALDEQHPAYGAVRLRDFRAHLAAMPAQPAVSNNRHGSEIDDDEPLEFVEEQREGDLAAWAAHAEERVDDGMRYLDEHHADYVAALGVFVTLKAHLAAMPAQRDVNAGLLEALKAQIERDGHTEACVRGQAGRYCSGPCYEATAAIAAAEPANAPTSGGRDA